MARTRCPLPRLKLTGVRSTTVLLLAALGGTACGSAEETSSSSTPASAPYSPYGGQTGSLIPKECGVQQASTTPSGDVAFIAYTELCPELPSRTQLLDAEGREVALAFEEVAPGVVSARTATALLPGNYEIRTATEPTTPVASPNAPGPAATAAAEPPSSVVTPLVIAEASPLPDTLGSLQVVVNGCTAQPSLTLSLHLPPEMAAYAALLRLTLMFNFDALPILLAEFGQVRERMRMQPDGSASLAWNLGTCGTQWPCGQEDDLVLEVLGHLAGEEDIPPYSISQSVNLAPPCPSAPPAEPACHLQGPTRRSGPRWAAPLFLLLGALARRRCRRRPRNNSPL